MSVELSDKQPFFKLSSFKGADNTMTKQLASDQTLKVSMIHIPEMLHTSNTRSKEYYINVCVHN